MWGASRILLAACCPDTRYINHNSRKQFPCEARTSLKPREHQKFCQQDFYATTDIASIHVSAEGFSSDPKVGTLGDKHRKYVNDEGSQLRYTVLDWDEAVILRN